MEFRRKGLSVNVDPARQSDKWLLNAAQEIAEAAKARGLELPAFTGVVAVEGATETKVDAREVITGQFDSAFTGYQTVAEQLNAGRGQEDQFDPADQETIAEEFTAWFSDEKVDYVAGAIEVDPELRFTLIATPNITATAEECIKLAETFGGGQPRGIDAGSKIIKRYTPEQLSGTEPANGNKVQFGLVPSKLNPDLSGTVPQQLSALVRLQANMPDLRIPSLLDDMTFWRTLRAQGGAWAEGVVFERTYVRHFDLPEQRHGDYDYVLYSCIYNIDHSDVNVSHVRIGDYSGRALLG